jgi:hypothetical protein
MVPDGAKSPAHNTFRDHDEEGLQALLKPVSQVRILAGALVVSAAQAVFLLSPRQGSTTFQPSPALAGKPDWLTDAADGAARRHRQTTPSQTTPSLPRHPLEGTRFVSG